MLNSLREKKTVQEMQFPDVPILLKVRYFAQSRFLWRFLYMLILTVVQLEDHKMKNNLYDFDDSGDQNALYLSKQDWSIN